MNKNTTPHISVVIPAYNEEDYLAACLHALRGQELPRHLFEIIVVDNNSTDLTASIAEIHGADRVVHESIKGTNQARQTGVNHSRGEIIAFLDADCMAPPHWLTQIEYEFTKGNPDMAALAGPYLYSDATSPRAAVAQKIAWNIIFPSVSMVMGRMFNKGGVMLGGNFAARKKDILAIQGFDTSYEFFGDDASIAKRFGQLGYVKFDPNHYVESSSRRFTREGFVRTNWNYTKNYLKVMARP